MWWGDCGERDNPHEGLDLCLYRNMEDDILRLDEKTNIPAMSDGVVVKIINDFLGRSVILEPPLDLFLCDPYNNPSYQGDGCCKPVLNFKATLLLS